MKNDPFFILRLLRSIIIDENILGSIRKYGGHGLDQRLWIQLIFILILTNKIEGARII